MLEQFVSTYAGENPTSKPSASCRPPGGGPADLKRRTMAQVSDRFGTDPNKKGSERIVYAMRADEVRPSLPHDLALANAPDKDENFFKVPKVIEK